MKIRVSLVALLLCVSTAHAQNYPAPIKALTHKGVSIVGSMQAPPGFKGYLGKYGGDPIPIYLLPDGKHVIVGTLYDSHGTDLTEAAFAAATRPRFDPALWDELAKSAWIAEGATKPRHIVYIFTDTECPYCHKLWQASRAYLRSGTLQVRNIIVAVIKPISLGRGAALLTANDPVATFERHETAFGHSSLKPLAKVDAGLRATIEANKALMDRFGAYGTPVIVYRDASHRLQMFQGIPDQSTMQKIFGTD